MQQSVSQPSLQSVSPSNNHSNVNNDKYHKINAQLMARHSMDYNNNNSNSNNNNNNNNNPRYSQTYDHYHQTTTTTTAQQQQYQQPTYPAPTITMSSTSDGNHSMGAPCFPMGVPSPNTAFTQYDTEKKELNAAIRQMKQLGLFCFRNV